MSRQRLEGNATHQGVCPECQAGISRLKYLTYFTWLNGELISVPNFPAWVCDVCGLREYDARAVLWLNTLLTPDARRRRATSRRQPRIDGSDQASTLDQP